MKPLRLELCRLIRASPERLFEAWTVPEQLCRWWGPPGVQCTGAEFDLRPGGQYRIDNLLPDGAVVCISGEFVEVLRPKRLVYTWQTTEDLPVELVTVEFIPRGPNTEVRVVHEKVPTQDLAERHELGWDGCLSGLATYIASTI